jgi:putative peptidoglycan lipid II flippase
MFLASLFPAARLEPFIIAFRIPNALRRFVAEGAFSISVVPVYSKIADPDYQKSVYRSLVTILTFVLAAAAILGWVFSSQLITLYAPGFRDSTAFDQAVQMLRIMFPYLVCLSYVALFMGVLNSHQHFFAPAIAPVILNLCMLAAMFWQARHGGGSLTVIAWAVLVSGLLQWVLQIPYLGKFDRMPALSKPIIYPELRRIFSLWLPAMWSVSIVQISTLIGTRFASLLPEGTLTGMYLAERIIELPLGGFAVAIGQAALPVLSKQIKESPKDFDETIVHAMLLSSLFALPAAVGIFILADPMVHVLYFRRAFAAETASITVDCLRMMAISLPFGAQLRT